MQWRCFSLQNDSNLSSCFVQFLQTQKKLLVSPTVSYVISYEIRLRREKKRQTGIRKKWNLIQPTDFITTSTISSFLVHLRRWFSIRFTALTGSLCTDLSRIGNKSKYWPPCHFCAIFSVFLDKKLEIQICNQWRITFCHLNQDENPCYIQQKSWY